MLTVIAEGDSGSWVVQDGRLCGMIVAGSISPPWAYMLLVEDIFSQIASYLPGVLSVSLPKRPEMGNDCSLSTNLSAERREIIEPLRPPPRQVHFKMPASADIPGTKTPMRHAKTLVSKPDMPIHNPLAQPTIRIQNFISSFSRGLLRRATGPRTEDTSKIPQQTSQGRPTTRKVLRHYPRSPARARREAALHRRSPPAGSF